MRARRPPTSPSASPVAHAVIAWHMQSPCAASVNFINRERVREARTRSQSSADPLWSPHRHAHSRHKASHGAGHCNLPHLAVIHNIHGDLKSSQKPRSQGKRPQGRASARRSTGDQGMCCGPPPRQACRFQHARRSSPPVRSEPATNVFSSSCTVSNKSRRSCRPGCNQAFQPAVYRRAVAAAT